jgi:tyrosyl-DNA phosphodiesterase 2
VSEGLDFPGYSAPPAAIALAVESFDPERGRWAAAPDGEHRAPTLAVATFNAWFQGPERPARIRGLLEVLERSRADVIFLEEATRPLVDAMMAADWVRASYRLASAPVREDAIPSHGLVVLSRPPLGDVVLHPLPTHMGRRVLVGEMKINGAVLALAAVHLESLRSNADTRASQLEAVFRLLEPFPDAVLAGDFNFCSSWTLENARIDPRFVDLWPALHPADPGYTQDTERNPMLAKAKGESKRVRIDRILLRSDARRWEPLACRLVGTEPVEAGSSLFPSDHFGVIATLRTVA